jgi:hypothetical protein
MTTSAGSGLYLSGCDSGSQHIAAGHYKYHSDQSGKNLFPFRLSEAKKMACQ